MPAIYRTAQLFHSPILPCRHWVSHTTKRYSSSYFRRSDFSGQGYTSAYDPRAPTVGPLSQASQHGAPRLTPTLLKEHLDKHVVGQTKAKKVTSVAIYNHYQRIREIRRLQEEELENKEREERRSSAERERNSHPVESTAPSPSTGIGYIADLLQMNTQAILRQWTSTTLLYPKNLT
jgi:hypothetical protein